MHPAEQLPQVDSTHNSGIPKLHRLPPRLQRELQSFYQQRGSSEGIEMKPLTQDETDAILRNTLREFNRTFREVRPFEGEGDQPQDLAVNAIAKAIRSLRG